MAAIAATVGDAEVVAGVVITRAVMEKRPSTTEATTTRVATVNDADKLPTGATMMVGRSILVVKDSASDVVAPLETTTMAWAVSRTMVRGTTMVVSDEVGGAVDAVAGEEEVVAVRETVLADKLSTRTEAISSSTCDCFDHPTSIVIHCY